MISIRGYRIEREIGRGGMACVYLAEQLSLNRLVALKVLHPQYAGEPKVAQRFLREGRIAASLHHRHIVAIHDIGEQEGRLYMALEYLPCGSIAALAGRMDVVEALRCVREIAGALDAAHRKGIVHRDVKPENILRHADGAYMLSDFGIAHVFDGAQALTCEGQAIGTPAYMSPEQWRDDPVDGRADLYGLGVVLYQLLVGEQPYVASGAMALGLQHLNAAIPTLPAPLRHVQPLLDGLLAKQPADRIGSGSEAARMAAAISSKAPSAGGTPAGVSSGTTAVQTPVASHGPAHGGLAEAEPASRRRKSAWLLALLIVPFTFGVWWAGTKLGVAPRGGETPTTAVRRAVSTVAVMPCRNWLTDPNQAWLGEGLADELIQRLARLQGIRVIARASSFALQSQNLTTPEIGRRLGAELLITCSLRDSPGGVRVVAELTDAASQTQRWAVQYDRAPGELLGAIDEIAVGVAERLLTTLVGDQRALLLRHNTENLEALRLYQASIPMGEQWTRESLREAETLLARSLELDPDFALARQARALLLLNRMQIDNLSMAEIAPAIEAELDEALRLDPELGEAYAVRCQLAMSRFDWARARADCNHAIRLSPNSGRVHYMVGQFEFSFGDLARGVAHELRFRELEPENAFSWQQVSAAYLFAGKPEAALLEADHAWARFPGNWVSQYVRALALLQLRRCPEAVEAFEAIGKIEPNLEFTGGIGAAYACAGRRKDALRVRDELVRARASGKHVTELNLALVELELGHVDAAIDALEAGHRAFDLATAQFMARELLGLPRLRGNPRYEALRTRMAFPSASKG
jgi:TolB-like protein